MPTLRRVPLRIVIESDDHLPDLIAQVRGALDSCVAVRGVIEVVEYLAAPARPVSTAPTLSDTTRPRNGRTTKG
jgi:hypothetical protein